MNEDRHAFDAKSSKMFSFEATVWRDMYLMKSLEKRWIQRYSRFILEKKKNEDRDEFLDKEICIEEAEEAIQLLKKCKVPGLKIYTVIC